MARPSKNIVNHGVEDWDASINDNFSLIFDTPIPVAVYADVASFPAASAYEDCIAVAQDTDQAYISDGSTWNLLGGASTFLGLSDTPNSFSGQAGKVPVVNSAEDALEFQNMAAGEDISREFYQDFSTSEKDMGMAWVDGKKIYAKVIDLGALPDGSSASALKSVAHNISGITNIIRLWSWAEHSDGHVIPLPYVQVSNSTSGEEVLLSANNANIYLRANGADFSSYTGKCVIWYTKSATGATDDNFLSFSTSEKKTGMNWFDGRPIYCKVLTDLVGPNGGEVQVAHNISNFAHLVALEAYFGDDSSNIWRANMQNVADNSGSYHRLSYASVDGTYLRYNAEGVNWSSRQDGHAIIYYVKSDDEVPSTDTHFGRDFLMAEVNTKTKWTDGKYIFKKVVDLGSLPNNGSDAIELGIENLGQILWVLGKTWSSTDSRAYGCPFFYVQPNAISWAFRKGPVRLARKSFADLSGRHSCAIVYYTKNLPETTKWIEESVTLHVVSSGGSADGDGSEKAPFDSVQHALDWLKNFRLKPGIEVTIQVANGTYSCNEIPLDHPDMAQVQILGDTTAKSAYSITAVNTGTKIFTISGNHASEFSSGDIIKVYGSSANDNLYTVNSASNNGSNTDITVNESIPDSTADGSLKSCAFGVVLDFSSSGENGFLIQSRNVLKIDGFVLKGSGSSNGKIGIWMALNASLQLGDNICITAFQGGINLYLNSTISGGSIAVFKCGSYHGLKAASSCAFSLADYAASCRHENGGHGIQLESRGVLYFNHGISCSNGGDGIRAESSASIVAQAARLLHNTSHGVELIRGADAELTDAHTNNNGSDGLHVVDGATAAMPDGEAKNNTGNGIFVWGMSGVTQNGATVTGNGTNYNPAVNTVGNRNSMIWT